MVSLTSTLDRRELLACDECRVSLDCEMGSLADPKSSGTNRRLMKRSSPRSSPSWDIWRGSFELVDELSDVAVAADGGWLGLVDVLVMMLSVIKVGGVV